MDVDADAPMDKNKRGKRVNATQHFLLEPRECLIHIAEVVDTARFDLMKFDRALHPDNGDLNSKA